MVTGCGAVFAAGGCGALDCGCDWPGRSCGVVAAGRGVVGGVACCGRANCGVALLGVLDLGFRTGVRTAGSSCCGAVIPNVRR